MTLKRHIGLVICLWIFLQSSVCALGVPIKGTAEKYKGRHVGAVHINDKVVMRFYSPGEFQNPYRRARYTADLLIKLLNQGYDLKDVKVMKGAIATVGIAGNQEIFRIYEEDVLANNAVPESLAAQWAKNIHDSIMISEIEIASEGKYLKTREEVPSRTQELSEKPAVAKPVTTEQRRPASQQKAESKSPGSPLNVTFMVIVIVASLIVLAAVIFVLIIQYKKLSLQKEGIVDHASGEELENLVSHLISELEDRSAKITSDFQEKIAYLENLLMKAESTVKELPAVPAVNELPEASSADEPLSEEEDTFTGIVEPEHVTVPEKKSAKRSAESVQQTSKAPRTKQEIIYELADQGKSVTDIAKQLGIGTGEVQLILDLKQ